MATGGGSKPKSSASEPRQRSSWQRTTSMSDKEDNISLSSMPNDLRPNNWDFSDWRPSSHKDQTKHRKKGNPEWEREQSVSQDSPPPSERQHGTPRTFPRTKMTPSTPTAQRVALENLRQHITFSDPEDDASNDGERNNERNLFRRRENLPGYTRQDVSNTAENQLTRPVPNKRDDRNNRNNNKQNQNEAQSSGKPDSSQIVGRLMQIRDYIKQAGSMMDSLRKSGDPVKSNKMSELSRRIKSLRQNEIQCLESLKHLWPGYRDEMDRLQKLMDHLKEQERGYTGLLQTILSVRGDDGGVNDMSREMTPNLEPMDDTQSIDLDVESEMSEREERSISASSRPRIEDKLGMTSDNDEDEADGAAQSDSSDKSSNMDDTVISGRKNQEWDFELGEEELTMGGVENPKEAAETLVALKQQQELLTKLIEQQEQMRALRGRQAALLAMQQDAESKLANARQKSNEARNYKKQLEEAAATMTNRAESLMQQSSNVVRQGDQEDLQDIRQQLQYLRNELKSTQNVEIQQPEPTHSNLPSTTNTDTRPKNRAPPPRPPSPKFGQSAVRAGAQDPQTEADLDMENERLVGGLQELMGTRDRLDKLLKEEFSGGLGLAGSDGMSHDQLQNKLNELQAKKTRMDDMLHELHSLRNRHTSLLNNAKTVEGATRAAAMPSMDGNEDLEDRLMQTEGTENLAAGAVGLIEARQKLQKLNEVKDRLSKLKGLVTYYQAFEPGSEAQQDNEDESSLPAYSDYGGEQEASRDTGSKNQREVKEKDESGRTQVNIPVDPRSVGSNDDNNSSSSSDTESQMSSLGPWGDDPEIQEKVSKLKAAKEKLKYLQNLVAMVQHSPDVAGEIPDNIAEIAASIEDAESQITQPEDRNGSASDGEIPQHNENDSLYQTRMQEQLLELEKLKNEKTRLLTIQGQLQSLHDRFAEEEEQRMEADENMHVKETRQKSQSSQQQNNQQESVNQQSSGPSVTFSSNEEVYDKMRKQRMLREELRDKKKQLESIMKKDRNKKSYYKNQDNQSDTVSYSTEPFGASASVDATMATWGGSTVDNLESITEDGAADPQDNEDDDDAYPSDGILQVEEEEEENQSDNETYTIEEDVRQRRKARSMAKAGSGEGNTRKTKRSFPRPSRQGEGGVRPKDAWTRPPDFSKWSRSGDGGGSRKSRQENYRSAEDIVDDEEDSPSRGKGGQKYSMDELQMKLGEISMMCQSLAGEQQHGTGMLARQTAAGFGSQMLPDLQQQLQQQQLMMSLNQCYQQISMQQMELQTMQRQMQSVLYQVSAGGGSEINESGMGSDLRVRSMPSLFSPMMSRQSPSINDHFVFNPQYPSNNRLLRRAVNETDEDGFAPVESMETGGARPKTRKSRSESYSQKSKAKKSQSPPVLNPQTLKQKSVEETMYQDDDGAVLTDDRALMTQKFEQTLARKKREFLERNKLKDRSASQQLSETGRRTGVKSRGSMEDSPLYRPGLSAGISGAGYQEDGRSVASSVQSSLAAMAQALNNQPDTREHRDSDDNPNEMSLFETLRETIYSEVATLISQNENRPHYLIELFRELQLLTSDYLRQRVLYDIKDVVSKYLVEENSISAPPPPWMNTAINNFTASELTPSESIVTSDDEEVRSMLQTKLKEKVAANLVARERQRQQHQHTTMSALVRSGSLQNEKYDYQEVADIDSSVSTPSNSYWDSPFNQDSLGETAINLDKTLEKMREYERKLEERDAKVKAYAEARQASESAEVGSSSAMDQGSESSAASDSVPYPRIDTQQLDQQIKSIMTEVIPVIKEHMDNMCSPQLLAYIKRLVLSLTRQYDGGQEFARFFHRQLGSILQDSLAKYEGRKMRECGEDLLVDMSEVLFNELAFFRLMQDLDDPLIAEKMRKAQSQDEKDKDSAEDEDDDDDDDAESDTTESSTANASDNQDDTRPSQVEEEELGKSRDDALANAVEIQDAEDKDESPESLFKGVQIELAPSETKPYTRIGSDEDDESADDESQSNEDPSETAVSINARRVNYIDDVEEDASRQDGTAPPVDNEETEAKAAAPPQQPPTEQNRDDDQGASSGKPEPQVMENMNGDVNGDMNGDMNGDLLNGDIEVITMDDLPPSMTIMSPEELQQKLSQEQQANAGAAVVLDAIDNNEELAGDPQHLKEPDETSC